MYLQLAVRYDDALSNADASETIIMLNLKSTTGATLIGMIAPLMWGASVSLVRTIAENFGIAQGQCLLRPMRGVRDPVPHGLHRFD